MRKCLRCDEVMIEDYGLRTENLTAVASVVLSKGDVFFQQKTWAKLRLLYAQSVEKSQYFLTNYIKSSSE